MRHRLNTVAGMISRWAPPCENHTEQYIRFVAETIGIADNDTLDTLDRPTMLRFAAAISQVENGAVANMQQVEAGWRLFGE